MDPMEQVEQFNQLLDKFEDNPVDCWSDHMERRDAAIAAAERRSFELVKQPTSKPEEAGEDVLELHPQDEPMDMSPVETGKEEGAACILELAEDLSNLPAKDQKPPGQIVYRGQRMTCPKRIAIALAFAREQRRFPRRLFIKSLHILRRDLINQYRDKSSGSGSKEEAKPPVAKPLPIPETGPKPRDLQARASAPIQAPKPGPTEGKKAKKKKSKASKSKPNPQGQPETDQPRAGKSKVEQPRAANAGKKQPKAAKPQPAPKVPVPHQKEPVSGPSRKGSKRKGGLMPSPKHLEPKSSKSVPGAENPLAQMALTQLGGMQALVMDLQAKLDRANRNEVRLSSQLDKATRDVRDLCEYIRDNGLSVPRIYSNR